jgi:hypothetical protein
MLILEFMSEELPNGTPTTTELLAGVAERSSVPASAAAGFAKGLLEVAAAESQLTALALQLGGGGLELAETEGNEREAEELEAEAASLAAANLQMRLQINKSVAQIPDTSLLHALFQEDLIEAANSRAERLTVDELTARLAEFFKISPEEASTHVQAILDSHGVEADPEEVIFFPDHVYRAHVVLPIPEEEWRERDRAYDFVGKLEVDIMTGAVYACGKDGNRL